MNYAVVSGICGEEWKEISDITWGEMDKYASRHGASFFGKKINSHGRPGAWGKLTAVAESLVTHDVVLWLDADVLIVDHGHSIFDEFDESAWQAMSVHPLPYRHHNTGVWLLRRQMIPMLVDAAMCDDCILHPWWEQAAIHSVTESRSIPTQDLHDHWNIYSYDASSPFQVQPRFLHAAGKGVDRLSVIREWSSS